MNTFNTTPIAFMNSKYQKFYFYKTIQYIHQKMTLKITPKQIVFYLYHGIQFLTSIESHYILGNDTK